jgi:8-oxo-dGTP diphosphatase
MLKDLPYRIAVLCYLFDRRGRVLLLHRRRPPNQDLYSPIGGKLDISSGESPTSCALREIWEESGLDLPAQRLHLTGIVSEAGFEHRMHWLMFLYEVLEPVDVNRMEFEEGLLEWHEPHRLQDLPIPQTDRQVIWPQFWAHRGAFFMAHIDCRGQELDWWIEQRHPRPTLPGPGNPPGTTA